MYDFAVMTEAEKIAAFKEIARRDGQTVYETPDGLRLVSANGETILDAATTDEMFDHLCAPLMMTDEE